MAPEHQQVLDTFSANAQATTAVVTEAPNMAAALGVPVESVGVKATTTERLGFVGREEGIAAWAVVLLERAE